MGRGPGISGEERSMTSCPGEGEDSGDKSSEGAGDESSKPEEVGTDRLEEGRLPVYRDLNRRAIGDGSGPSMM